MYQEPPRHRAEGQTPDVERLSVTLAWTAPTAAARSAWATEAALPSREGNRRHRRRPAVTVTCGGLSWTGWGEETPRRPC